MKALTVRQPWASLVAAGIKTVETRSWATKHRGPVAIHAGVKRPRLAKWKPGEPGPADLAVHEVADPAHSNGQKLCYCGWDAKTCLRQGLSSLPLGAVVATANLVDCVPMVDPDEPMAQHHQEHERWVAVHPNVLTLSRRDGAGVAARSIHDQRPFGDYTPGRWAWLLDDIKPTTARCPHCWGAGVWAPRIAYCPDCDLTGRCDPIPAKGRRGLWEWTP